MPRTINSTVLRSKSVKVNFCMDAKINLFFDHEKRNYLVLVK